MLDFNPVLPELFVGSCPRSDMDIQRLQSGLGASAVLNLQTDYDFNKWGVNWKALEKAYQKSTLLLTRFPIRDFDMTDLATHLRQATNELSNLIQSGHRVYLHCTAGMDRAPTVATAYLCFHRDMPLEKAVQHVEENRSVARIKIDIIEKLLQQPALYQPA